MYVKNGCKDLKRYPQISRRVRDTLARLLLKTSRRQSQVGWLVLSIPNRESADYHFHYCYIKNFSAFISNRKFEGFKFDMGVLDAKGKPI